MYSGFGLVLFFGALLIGVGGDQHIAAKRVSSFQENQVDSLDAKLEQLARLNDKEEESNEIEEQQNPHRGRGKLSCLSCSAPNCDHQHVCHAAVRCYTAHVRDVDGTEHKSKGCTRDHQQTMFHCATIKYDGKQVFTKNNRSAQYAFECCKDNMCNNNTVFPTLPNIPVIDDTTDDEDFQITPYAYMILAIVLPIVVLFLIASGVIILMHKNHLKKMEKMARNPEFGEDCELAGLRAHAVGDSTLREYQIGMAGEDSCMTSGSGSGGLRLIRRTLAKDIELLTPPIGKGRYGEVWQGRWNGGYVAVKIFFSRDEESFQRETKIYSTVLLRHDNILGYTGSDCTSRNSCTQNWLVTHYHANGSLYDYLNRPDTSLSTEEAFRLIISALTGLVHLHTEVHGTQGKPAIAHRDIKSKNILVRDDGSCVIADFGLAVTQSEMASLIMDVESNTRVGTKRYMSPEVLDFSIIQKKNIEAFKQSDIYSFALVMWEVMRKTRVIDSDPNSSEEYALPYHTDVGPDPSFEEMRKVVCTALRRPDNSDKWMQNTFMASMTSMMQFCWHEKPSVRHTGLRLKKSLHNLKSTSAEGMSWGATGPPRGTRPVYVPPPTLNKSNSSVSQSVGC